MVDASGLCPQPGPVSPKIHAGLAASLDDLFVTPDFKNWAIESLSRAVRIPSTSYDGMSPPGEDPRWEIMLVFHSYLRERFPLVHEHLQLTKINLYALLFHWQGTDSSLKPLLLTAHQDVVPVLDDTLNEWIHPPFSGHYDGKWIWGRGSCDDKAGLVGILSSIETLLEKDFRPRRSVVLSFGIDEESSGPYGAGALADYLYDVYGENAFAMLVDEGGRFTDHGIVMASPGVSEKGYMNVMIGLTTPGGHSSVPTSHTGIGLLSTLIQELEDHPFPTVLKREGAYFAGLQCAAVHDTSLAESRRDLIIRATMNDAALEKLHAELTAEGGNQYLAITGTTQGIDLIHGGIKVNALPEYVWAGINHRVADYSSYDEVRTRYATVLAPVAERLNLSLDIFGDIFGAKSSVGHVRVATAFDQPVSPAPDAPTFGSPTWTVLAGTIRDTLASTLRTDAGPRYSAVAPALGLGTTDTKYYGRVSNAIYRYRHLNATDSFNGAHTTNEAMNAEGYIEMIRFYSRFILNVDEANLD
ncbi:hypothetical protein K488DRAFT_81093 [Vararia minispora EC-137]|uniref:Uncharacterized protein n=1 Tax=Vararia minispora EC-137 TaxID=1314806 RepID=A0ACB8Q771_9AGAM|nr:hypothetical protein K488DRAFT_81093 [Vararia minispora EC-137]